jgi:hypothetical protein
VFGCVCECVCVCVCLCARAGSSATDPNNLSPANVLQLCVASVCVCAGSSAANQNSMATLLQLQAEVERLQLSEAQVCLLL